MKKQSNWYKVGNKWYFFDGFTLNGKEINGIRNIYLISQFLNFGVIEDNVLELMENK